MTAATLVSFEFSRVKSLWWRKWSAKRRGNDGRWGRQSARWAGALWCLEKARTIITYYWIRYSARLMQTTGSPWSVRRYVPWLGVRGQSSICCVNCTAVQLMRPAVEDTCIVHQINLRPPSTSPILRTSRDRLCDKTTGEWARANCTHLFLLVLSTRLHQPLRCAGPRFSSPSPCSSQASSPMIPASDSSSSRRRPCPALRSSLTMHPTRRLLPHLATTRLPCC